MGKKGIKRRTRWRTLSITDSADEASTVSPTNCSNSDAVASRNNDGEVSSKDDTYRHPNSSYLRRKPLYDSSANVRSGYSRGYFKQHSGGFSPRTPYYRRPLQNGASRFFNYRTGAQNNRSADTNKEYNQARPIINEEEYTRITTPRQDVIFKKGYLSQPRKYLSSTDTNTTSSAAASVVSTEESISAASVPSLSPEQCSSYAESVDPEQALMYSYFDQNGVLYFNPYLPNGFDQYAGQMFMLPYSYQPYNVYPSDVNSPPQSTDIEETQTSTDSNENLSDNKETHKQETTPESPIDCDEKAEPPASEKTTTEDSEKSSEDVVPQAEQTEVTANQMENFYNYAYQQFYPQMFFPYMCGQQFMPMIETDYEPYAEYCDEGDERGATLKNRRRTRAQDDGSSTGVTTTDCSEEDYSDKENTSDIVETEKNSAEVTTTEKAENTEELKKIVFNADVEEFIPRQSKPHLNVNVKEFLPKNYKPKRSTTSIEGNDKKVVAEKVKEYLPKPQRKPTKKDKDLVDEAAHQSNSTEDTSDTSAFVTKVATVETAEPTISTKPIQEIPKITLAERIKRGFVEDSADTEQSSPPKNNSANLVIKKSLKKNEIKTALVKEVPGMTFAKVLTKERPKPTKSQVKFSSAVNTSNTYEKHPAKELTKQMQKQPEPITVQSNSTAEKEINQDEWQTVKPKGKRARHFVKEVVMAEELPIEEEALDQKVPDENVHKKEVVKTTEVPEVNVNEKSEENIEKEIILKIEELESDSVEKPQSSPIIKNPDIQNSQKKNKLRNKKTKKNPSPPKKTKEKEVLRTSSEEKDEKTDQRDEDVIPQEDDPLLDTPNSTQEEHILDSLYLMDRSSSLLNKRFCRNPLEILNGFDCKFKGNKSILKEEEDMVLNVIKALSTNQTKIIEIKCPQDLEELNTENTEKTAPTIVEEQGETGSSNKKTGEESEVNEIKDDTQSPISNGISNDCEPDCPEDVDEDTIVQEVPEEILNYVSDKLSDAESLSDLSVEDFEKKGDTKDCLAKAEVIIGEICSESTYLDDNKEEKQLLEIEDKTQVEDEQKKATTISEHQEEFSSQTIHKSLEENETNDPEASLSLAIDGHNNESCDLLSHSLEQNALLADSIPTYQLTNVTNKNIVENNFVLQTADNGEINKEPVFEVLVLETAVNGEKNDKHVDEVSDLETAVNTEINEKPADKVLVLATVVNGEANEKTVDKVSVLRTSIMGESDETNVDVILSDEIHSSAESNETTINEPFPKEITIKVEENGNEILEASTKEIEANSTIKREHEDPFFDIESLKPFKHNAEEKVDIKAVFEQKMKEIDEELKSRSSKISQGIENAAHILDEEEEQTQVLKERNNCLPEEVLPPKADLIKPQAPEEVMHQFESNVGADKRNHSNDSQEIPSNVALALLESVFEQLDLEAVKNSPLSTIEGKDVAPTADLQGDPPPNGEEMREDDLQPLNSIFLESPLEKLSSSDVIEKCHYESCVENKTAGSNPHFAGDKLDIKTDLVTNAALNEDDLCLESISPTNDSGITSSPRSFCQISNATHDSNKSDLSTINISALDEDPNKYPLTMAVREWLNQEAKEKTPEPIFRIPNDPKLSSIITSSLIEQTDRRNGDFEEWTSEESDEEEPQVKPKNLQSNPSRVSSVNLMSNDNDSDYNSDSQQRFDEDDNTCERVAAIISDMGRRGDLLDYWDDEFVRDPKKWLGASSCSNDDKESVFSTTPSEPLSPYESVYGRSINYERLLASNYEFLSNNIISFNGTSPAGDKQERTDESRHNNNNDNFNTNINGNHNCLKPPEVCCMIM